MTRRVYGIDVTDGREVMVELTIEDDGTCSVASVILHDALHDYMEQAVERILPEIEDQEK